MRGNPVRGCWGRGTRQSHRRERELRAVTEGKASSYSWSGEGRESWSGQHKRPGQTMQSLLGSWSGAGFILNVVSSHQRGITI